MSCVHFIFTSLFTKCWKSTKLAWQICNPHLLKWFLLYLKWCKGQWQTSFSISKHCWKYEIFWLFQLSISGSAIWINPFVGILTIIALWPVAIMFIHLRTTLRTVKIIPKYAMYQVTFGPLMHFCIYKEFILNNNLTLRTQPQMLMVSMLFEVRF